ncbi:MAG: glycosyltransferase family 2 protein [Hyphomicrobiales bacterium]|nr:glycosyltransferase family 2 protein [Hyphomicrobiales bacterium]
MRGGALRSPRRKTDFRVRRRAAPAYTRAMSEKFFDDVIARVVRGEIGGIETPAAICERLRDIARNAPGDAGVAADLVGRPCASSAPLWHAQAFERACHEDNEGAVVRRLYHLRWLAHLCCPEDERFRPTVSLVIPAYNAAGLVTAAIDSCLAQDPAPDEIIVVDDGSSDDTAGAVARFGDRIRLIAQSNRGVSAARNTGVATATGDFIHFLDADDTLLARALADKIAAFRSIPDADLCFSSTLDQGADGRRPNTIPPPDGGPRCATNDFAYAVVRGPALLPSTVMMPRLRALAADLFDETLRRTEDRRYFFRLAVAGVKAIAVGRPLARRRLDTGGAAGPGRPPHEYKAVAVLMNLIDAVDTPRMWRYAPFILLSRWYRIVDVADDRLDTLRQTVRDRLAELGDGAPRGGLSPLLLIQNLALALDWFERNRPRLTAAGLAYHSDIRQALSAAAATAAGPGPADRVYWLDGGPCHGSARPLLDAFSALDDDTEFLADLRRLEVPAASVMWRLTERLAPGLGAARAGHLARVLTRALGPSLRLSFLYRTLADSNGDWMVGDGERWPPRTHD